MSDTKTKTKSKTPNPTKKVEVLIPKRFKGDDARTVSVNGRYLTIPTGRVFSVDREFAEVVFNASLADDDAEKHRAALAKD